MIDVLYPIRLNEISFQTLFKFQCSIYSLLKGTIQDIRICIADTSPISLREYLKNVLKIDFDYFHKPKDNRYFSQINLATICQNYLIVLTPPSFHSINL